MVVQEGGEEGQGTTGTKIWRGTQRITGRVSTGMLIGKERSKSVLSPTNKTGDQVATDKSELLNNFLLQSSQAASLPTPSSG